MIVEMSKGKQITIPAEIRNQFDLGIGSKLELFSKRKEIILKPVGDELDKLLDEAKNVKPKHNMTAEQMDELNEGLLR